MMNDDDGDLGQDSQNAAPSTTPGANGNAIINPGPVFDSVDDAARDALSQINPVSKAQNREYAWGFYYDRNTGKIGYSDPVQNSVRGHEKFTLNIPGVPIGMGHTHGDYSTMGGSPVSPDADEFNSDQFSQRQPHTTQPGDMEFMRNDVHEHPTWSYYLGTPSGKFLKWTSDNGVEKFQ